MSNKKMILILGSLVLIVSATAWIAIRMIDREVNPLNSDGALQGRGEFTFSSSNNLSPAVELPVTAPEVTGLYVEWKDNTMIIQAASFDPGIGGVLGNSVDVNNAPKVEIVLTAKTTIFRDTTQVNSSSGDNFTIHQTVEESTLDGLAPPTMITVWGRRSGDRIIGEVLLYANSLHIQKP